MTPEGTKDDVDLLVEAVRAAVKYHARHHVDPNPHTDPLWLYLHAGANLGELVEGRGAWGSDPSWLDSAEWDRKRLQKAAAAAVKAGRLFAFVDERATRWKTTYVLPETKAAVDAELALTEDQRLERSLADAKARVERERDERMARPGFSSDDVDWMPFRTPYGVTDLVGMGEIVYVGKSPGLNEERYVLAEHHAQYTETIERARRNREQLMVRGTAALDALNAAVPPTEHRKNRQSPWVQLDVGQAEALLALLAVAADVVDEAETLALRIADADIGDGNMLGGLIDALLRYRKAVQ